MRTAATSIALACILAGCTTVAPPDNGAMEENGDSTVEENGKSSSSAAEDNPAASQIVAVTYGGFYYDPKTITVQQGQTVTLNFSGSGVHDFVIDALDIRVDLTTQSTVTFTAPAPGEYVFYCSIPGHRERGMFGTLIVEE